MRLAQFYRAAQFLLRNTAAKPTLQGNSKVPRGKPVPTRTPDFGFNWLKR